MRTISVAVLATSLLAASFIATNVNVLCNSDVVNAVMTSETSKNALLVGDIHHLFLMKQVWQNFPSFPSPFQLNQLRRYFDWTAFLLTGSLIAGAIWVLRARMSTNWLVVGLAVLPLSMIPYVVGRIALHNNVELEHCGAWLTMMLLGVLYPVLACAACAVFELCSMRKQTALLDSIG